MSYLLDTNTCIRYLNGESERVRRRLASRAVLVTHNTREFGRVSGLEWEDWE